MMPGETILSGANPECSDCGPVRGPLVLSSAAGYYVGYACDCGPSYSRETGYFRTREAGQQARRDYIQGRNAAAKVRT